VGRRAAAFAALSGRVVVAAVFPLACFEPEEQAEPAATARAAIRRREVGRTSPPRMHEAS
jgi:hypothetical protein